MRWRRTRARARARDAPGQAGGRTAPPTTPPRRSRRTSWSPWRPPLNARRRCGLERELLVPLVRATVENWAALGPERALTGPVARGDEATVNASAPPSRSGRRTCCRCSTRSSTPPARSQRPGRPNRMKALPTIVAVRAALRAAAPRRQHGRAGPDDGRVPRGPPVADAPRARAMRRRGRVAVRQPDPVQRRRPTCARTPATSERDARWPRSSASTTCSRRATTESIRRVSPRPCRSPA